MAIHVCIIAIKKHTGLNITAGHRTMSGVNSSYDGLLESEHCQTIMSSQVDFLFSTFAALEKSKAIQSDF